MRGPRKTHLMARPNRMYYVCQNYLNLMPPADTGKPCDICGDIGYEETLATCFHCKLTCEHIYCMRDLLHITPEIWFCEACRSSKDIVSPKFTMKKHFPTALRSKKSGIKKSGIFNCEFLQSVSPGKILENSGRSGSLKKKMHDGTSRVKFIPPEEAVKMLSGARMAELYSPSDLGPSSAQSDTMATKSKYKISSPKFSLLNVNEHQSPRPTGHSDPPVRGSVDINSVTQEQMSQTSELKDKTAPAAYKNGPMCERFSLVCKEEPVAAPSLCCSGGVFHGNAKPEEADGEESDLLNILPEIEKNLPNYPAVDATWCGSFEIPDTVSRSEFYDEFRAYLPVNVHPKVFETSNDMPGVLLCTFLPRCNIWADVFQNCCPSVNDIALYFFPGKLERSKEQYFSLLGLIEMQDLVLRSSVNDVELLIFSSKRLHLDSCGLELASFLWGIFRPLEGNLAVATLPTHDMIFPACGQSSDVEMKVKMESFNGLDILPGFSKQAAGDTAHDLMLINSSNSVDLSAKGSYPA